MDTPWHLILVVLAFAVFVVGAFVQPARPNLVSAGPAIGTLAFLVH